MTDDSEIDKLRTELRESEENFRALMDSLVDGLVIIGADGAVRNFNPSAEGIFGYTSEEVMGKNVSLLMPEPFHGEHDGYINAYVETGDAKIIGIGREVTGRRKDGSTFPMELAVGEISRRQSPRFVGIIRDISERKLAERTQQQFLRAIENLSEAFALYGPDDRLIVCNDRFRTVSTGMTDVIVSGSSFEDLMRDAVRRGKVPEASGHEEDWIAKRLEHHRDPDGPLETVLDGRRFQIREERLPDQSTLVFILDITEQKAAEDQLRHAQKMEALGQLTGGVAHDFNNMLAVLMMDLEILDELTEGQEELHELVREGRDVTRTGADLTQRLLAFSRRQQLNPVNVNLNDLISETTGLLRRSLGEAIRIDTIGPSDLWQVHADHGQLVNALVNLAVNARDAMPSGGRLTIETTNLVLDEQVAAIPDSVRGECVRLRVSDTGTGMTPEVLDRALEPFFTTKDLTTGTGLGLSMVYGFIKQSGGHVAIESEPGRGTAVSLYLPRSTLEEGKASPSRRVSAVLPRGTEKILLVEDHTQLRKRTSRVLAELGYQVVQADNGNQALQRLDDDPAIDLLFTDVVMPGDLHGPELADRARQSRPELNLLFATGYADQAEGLTKFLRSGAKLLRKPYSKRDVAMTIRRILDGNH